MRGDIQQERLKNHFNSFADEREKWLKKSKYFHEEDLLMINEIIPKNSSVLEIGCGTGNLIGQLDINYGVGIDISEKSIFNAKKKFSDIKFFCCDSYGLKEKTSKKFDFIIISDTVGYFKDIQKTLSNLHSFCSNETRLIISYYSPLWEPVLRIAEKINLKMPTLNCPLFSTSDLTNFLKISGFETIKVEKKIIFPLDFFYLGRFINRFFANLPIINHLCLRQYIISRSLKKVKKNYDSVSVIVPCKNESGNIKNCIKRLPVLGKKMEVIFVEGNSSDKTWETIISVMKSHNTKKRGFSIRAFKQDKSGKKNAVFIGFEKAKNDILMILDCDLTVPPEELPKFWEKISCGEGEFINGTRLVYPLRDDAMRFLNYAVNKIFAHLFSWVLGQKITDTLCGTKVISKRNYLLARKFIKDFDRLDPFGDFFFIFSSFKLNLKMIEIPIRYYERTYGETQISRFRDGFKLLKMFLITLFRFKSF